MKTPVMLLLTNDPGLEDSMAQALLETGGISHLTRNAGDALQIVCGASRDLDLAVVDFESGPYGMTLLSAIRACREDLPLIAITRDDQEHVEPLAYANGASACLSKPVSPVQLADTMKQCHRPQHQLALVA